MKRNEDGFTLIEVVVAIMLIAVITGASFQTALSIVRWIGPGVALIVSRSA